MNKAEINDQIKQLLENDHLNDDLQEQADDLFTKFSELRNQSEEEQKESFINDGGDPVEFSYEQDDEDKTFNNLKTTFTQRLEKEEAHSTSEKEQSFDERQQIISELQNIVKTDVKNLGKHFRKASELQDRWKETKSYDTEEFQQQESDFKSDLDKFYYNAQIVKDAINLDYQKNLEAKEKVLDKIRDLKELNDVNEIEKKIRQYRKEWYRVGPVKKEIRDESREKLEEAVDSLQPKLDELYEDQKELLQENLKKKITICEQLNDILGKEYNTPKQFQAASDKVIKLQDEWKEIGRSEENDRIWEVFNSACDNFFDSKRAFFRNLSDIRQENKKEKEKLIQKAESKKDSTDWKKTKDYLINLQKQWEQVGPAHPKEDQKLWNQFRKACDVFFDARKKHYKERDKQYAENLKMKETLIQQLKDFEPSGNSGKDVQKIQQFEKEYKSIGFVPYKKKDEIHQEFYNTLNNFYDELNVDRKEKAKMRFEGKVKAMATGRKPDKTLNYEKNRIRKQIEELQQTLNQYENNVSFTKNNDDNPLVKSIKKNMRQTKRQIERLEMKLSLVKDAKAGRLDFEEE